MKDGEHYAYLMNVALFDVGVFKLISEFPLADKRKNSAVTRWAADGVNGGVLSVDEHRYFVGERQRMVHIQKHYARKISRAIGEIETYRGGREIAEISLINCEKKIKFGFEIYQFFS